MERPIDVRREPVQITMLITHVLAHPGEETLFRWHHSPTDCSGKLDGFHTVEASVEQISVNVRRPTDMY
jgi:hypothetical protein